MVGTLQLTQEAAPVCTQTTCLPIVEGGLMKLLSAPFRVGTDSLPVQTPETTAAVGIHGFHFGPQVSQALGFTVMACSSPGMPES